MPQLDTESKVKALKDSVASQVRMARADKRLSQDEVAQQAGTTQARISEIEIGNADPRLSTIARVVGVLGLKVIVVPDSAAA